MNSPGGSTSSWPVANCLVSNVHKMAHYDKPKKGTGIRKVECNIPLDTLRVISETNFPASHLTGAKKTCLPNQSLGWY